ncbi:MAG: MBL fold metallo-hydrolase [Planctomycetia bacterium]|nr:MBL fold metallo-hydrolase [Planctomycetia bacterium]
MRRNSHRPQYVFWAAAVLGFRILLPGALPAAEPKPATAITRAANERYLAQMPFADEADFADARRGLIAEGIATIRDARGRAVWDLSGYAFLNDAGAPPESVHPGLWRMARLNMSRGLFQVTDRVYQVRGYDLSNIGFIVGDTGYIVIDPLVSSETAKAALELVYEHVGKKPVVAIIYSHSHVDHFGGSLGVAAEAEVRAGRVRVIASEGFREHAVSENVMAGNAMTRRSTYMYGTVLPLSPRGKVDDGIGKGISSGRVTALVPTEYVTATGQELTIDGVKIVFQLTKGTEAPTEMNFYFPQFKALCMADNCLHVMHNLYTPRGAEIRDAKAWSAFLNETVELYGDKTDVMFAGHHWPRWTSARIVDMLKKQRDLYKYIHDQTLRLANQGYTPAEIAEQIALPDELAREWYNRGNYGTLRHNIKAVYQKYIGWFDGNPANLDPLPAQESARKYVEFMGGAPAVLEKARASFAKGEYRWVSQVVNHVVFAEPDNRDARELQADALEQLGYQAESASWRNFYLAGARELRDGITKVATPQGRNPDMIRVMTVEMIFDYLAVRLNGTKARGKKLVFNWNFTDTKEQYVLSLENCALTVLTGKQAADADVTLTLARTALDEMLSGGTSLVTVLASGRIKVQGETRKLVELFSLLDDFDIWFNIVTPHGHKRKSV